MKADSQGSEIAMVKQKANTPARGGSEQPRGTEVGYRGGEKEIVKAELAPGSPFRASEK